LLCAMFSVDDDIKSFYIGLTFCTLDEFYILCIRRHKWCYAAFTACFCFDGWTTRNGGQQHRHGGLFQQSLWGTHKYEVRTTRSYTVCGERVLPGFMYSVCRLEFCHAVVGARGGRDRHWGRFVDDAHLHF
jgi:hypothetical protein